MSELATQIVSGLVVAMLIAGTALWLRSRQSKQVQPEKPATQDALPGPTFPSAISKDAWIADFDERFYALKSATNSELYYKASENLETVFSRLLSLPSWDDPVRRNLSELLGFIGSRLQEQSLTEQMKTRYLKWVYWITTDKRGEKILPIAKAKLSDIVETLYRNSLTDPDPDAQMDRIIVTLLQLFDPNSVDKLVDDATMGWSYTRFNQGWQNIALKPVRERNPTVFKEICGRLLERADKYPNLEVRSRAYRLWQGTLDP